MGFMFRLLPSKLCASIVHAVFCVHTLGSSYCIIVFLGFCVLCVCKLCVFVLYFMCFVLCVFVFCVMCFYVFVFCLLCFVLYVAGPGSSHAQAISAVGLFHRPISDKICKRNVVIISSFFSL